MPLRPALPLPHAPRAPQAPDRRTVCTLLCGLALTAGSTAACAQAQAQAQAPEAAAPGPGWLRTAQASDAALQLVRWTLATHDHGAQPFAVVDKPAARIHVFAAGGRWLGSAPVLLGSAYGDTSVPGIGDRPLAQIRPEERTTPAGRFASEPGRNTRGDDLVWIDYDSAVSLHRVRSVHLSERRQQRLASPQPAERRISNGCVNVAHAFYDRVIAPTLGRTPGVVYVLPDSTPFATIFIAASTH